MTKLVYATHTAALHDSEGILRRVIRNEPWDADDDLVKLHPGSFSEEPIQIMRTHQPRIEAATRAPGEQRGKVKA